MFVVWWKVVFVLSALTKGMGVFAWATVAETKGV